MKVPLWNMVANFDSFAYIYPERVTFDQVLND